MYGWEQTVKEILQKRFGRGAGGGGGLGAVACDGLAPHPGLVAMFLVALCYGN